MFLTINNIEQKPFFQLFSLQLFLYFGLHENCVKKLKWQNNCDVFFGRTEELERMKAYITGPSTRPFVMYGAGGSGKSSMLSMTAYRAAYEWLQPAKPLLFVRFCGTTPNSTSLGPLLKSICQQISYTFLLPFQVVKCLRQLRRNKAFLRDS